MSLFVILDDTDGALKYTLIEPEANVSNGWSRFGTNGDYLGTSTATACSGAAMTFTFSDTSINLYASLQNQTTATYEILIDGTMLATFDQIAPGSDTVYHQLIFSTDSLSDGSHTLEMVLPVANTTFGAGGLDVGLYLDYLIYEPTPNTTLNAGYLFIDDTSGYIQYSSSGWESNTIQNWAEVNYLSYNSSLTTATEHQATANITFIGTSIIVWGAIPLTAVSSTFAIATSGDSTHEIIAPASFEEPNGADNILGGMAWNQILFQQNNTDDGPHTISLISLIAGALNLDFLTISTIKAYIPPVLPAADVRPTTTGKSPTSHPTGSGNLGAIIGGAVGGLVALVIVVFLVLWYRRWGRVATRFGILTDESTQSSGKYNNLSHDIMTDAPNSGIPLAPVRPANFYANLGLQEPNHPVATSPARAGDTSSEDVDSPAGRAGRTSNLRTRRLSYSSFMPEEGYHHYHLVSSVPSPPPLPPIPAARGEEHVPNTADWRRKFGSTTTVWTNSPPPGYTAT